MPPPTPDEAWIDVVRDCGRVFAAGEGVVSGAGVAVRAGSDGAAVLIASFPSTAAAGGAANRMMALARLYFMEETWRAVVIPPRAL